MPSDSFGHFDSKQQQRLVSFLIQTEVLSDTSSTFFRYKNQAPNHAA